MNLAQGRVCIIDFSSLYHRAYHVAEKNQSSGQTASEILSKMLIRCIRELRPRFLILALDRDDSLLERRKVIPNYKERDRERPEEFYQQMSRALLITDTLGIPRVSYSGYEADDVIATLTQRCIDQVSPVCIVSTDKDVMQCMEYGDVTWYDLKQYMGKPEVYTKYGFTPGEFVSVHALAGDKVDNLPGVSGIGVKTAVSLLRSHGDSLNCLFEAVEKNPEGFTPSLYAKLKDQESNAMRTARVLKLANGLPLMTVPITGRFTLDANRRKSVAALFTEFGFSRFVKGDIYLL